MKHNREFYHRFRMNKHAPHQITALALFFHAKANTEKRENKIKNPVELSFKVKSKIEHERAKEKHEQMHTHTSGWEKYFFPDCGKNEED